MSRIWVADTEPSERFPLYSRGNVGEVFPHAMTALTGTLIGDAVGRGQLQVVAETGALGRRERVGPIGTGVFGGYLYVNHSIMRVFGRRMPGLSVDDIDEQVTGGVADLPPYRAAPGDRNLLASVRLAYYSISLLRAPDLASLDVARSEAQAWLATMPDLVTAGDEALLAWLGTYPPRLTASMARLLRASFVAAAPRGFIDRILDRREAPPGLANRIVGATGDVDSARIAQKLWQLSPARRHRCRHLGTLRRRARRHRRALRGNRRWSRRWQSSCTSSGIAATTSTSWRRPRGRWTRRRSTPPSTGCATHPTNATRTRPPIRGATDAEAALAEALDIVPVGMRRLTRRFAALARSGGIARERAKDILVLENHGARQVLHELARRAAERGGPTEVRRAFCVTADELAEFVTSPGAFEAVIDERQARYRFLAERVPPPWFEVTIPPPATWPLRASVRPAPPAAGTVMTGIAVSGGCAAGPARVVLDPNQPGDLEPGDVLVCPITDPSWTPLFLGAAAVACESGADSEPRRDHRPRARCPCGPQRHRHHGRRQRHPADRRRRPRHRDRRLTVTGTGRRVARAAHVGRTLVAGAGLIPGPCRTAGPAPVDGDSPADASAAAVTAQSLLAPRPPRLSRGRVMSVTSEDVGWSPHLRRGQPLQPAAPPGSDGRLIGERLAASRRRRRVRQPARVDGGSRRGLATCVSGLGRVGRPAPHRRVPPWTPSARSTVARRARSPQSVLPLRPTRSCGSQVNQ